MGMFQTAWDLIAVVEPLLTSAELTPLVTAHLYLYRGYLAVCEYRPDQGLDALARAESIAEARNFVCADRVLRDAVPAAQVHRSSRGRRADRESGVCLERWLRLGRTGKGRRENRAKQVGRHLQVGIGARHGLVGAAFPRPSAKIRRSMPHQPLVHGRSAVFASCATAAAARRCMRRALQPRNRLLGVAPQPLEGCSPEAGDFAFLRARMPEGTQALQQLLEDGLAHRK